MTQKRLFQLIVLVGLLPSLGIFIWGVRQSLMTKSETIVPFFSQMK